MMLFLQGRFTVYVLLGFDYIFKKLVIVPDFINLEHI